MSKLPGNLIGDDVVRDLREIKRVVLGGPRNRLPSDRPPRSVQAPEVYMATVGVSHIPAISGDTPGSGEVFLRRLDAGGDLENWTVSGAQLVKQVVNLKGHIPAGYQVEIYREKRGAWIVDGPDELKGVTVNDINAGSTGSVTVWVDGAATSLVVPAYLDWMHGGNKVAAGEQVIIRWFRGQQQWVIRPSGAATSGGLYWQGEATNTGSMSVASGVAHHFNFSVLNQVGDFISESGGNLTITKPGIYALNLWFGVSVSHSLPGGALFYNLGFYKTADSWTEPGFVAAGAWSYRIEGVSPVREHRAVFESLGGTILDPKLLHSASTTIDPRSLDWGKIVIRRA